jgi:ABC-2 type transport system permease protein
MKNFFTLWRRELTACFLSPVAYVTLVVFLLFSGGTFLLVVFANRDSGEPLPSMMFASISVWLTILVTVVSMRLFSEEKRMGTLETLLTAPVTDAQVVFGKYAGALTFLLVVVAPAVGVIFVFNWLSPGVRYVDPGAVAAGSLVLFLVAALCMAIGMTLSLLTENQIVAAICTFCAVWVVLLLGWLLSLLPFGSGTVVEAVSGITHIADAARGVVDTRPVVLYLSGTAFMLFVAVRLLEMRRWQH